MKTIELSLLIHVGPGEDGLEEVIEDLHQWLDTLPEGWAFAEVEGVERAE